MYHIVKCALNTISYKIKQAYIDIFFHLSIFKIDWNETCDKIIRINYMNYAIL